MSKREYKYENGKVQTYIDGEAVGVVASGPIFEAVMENERAKKREEGLCIIAAAAIFRGNMYFGKNHADLYDKCGEIAVGENPWKEIRQNCGWLYSNGEFVR